MSINRGIRTLFLAIFILALPAIAARAQLHAPVLPGADLRVDVELILAVDVSRSMDASEQALQRRGYIEALRSPEVIAAIRSGNHGRIAIAYVEWSGPQSQDIVVPWSLIEDAESAEMVAARIAPLDVLGRRGTSISAGLAFASAMFDNNFYAGDLRVIDVSGDGANNIGPPVAPMRDAVVARGITINGLPIVLDTGNTPFSVFDIQGLDQYYRDCVTGGPNSFTIPVTSVEQFETAIRHKLILEISANDAYLMPVAVSDRPATSDCMIGESMRQHWLVQ